jgi:hypothetical protein
MARLKQGITNTLALPIDKNVVHLPHFKHQKNPFESKQSKHFHIETGSPNVKPVLIR